ncbi:hypothetical protein PWT90_09245 [Aphanocladium album]|nr:hypothetical protein PWT90_09245 [Aphanocladium album]
MPAGAGSKRPRLSLQIKPAMASTSTSASSRPASRGFPLNPSDPTAFNTLSNAYVTAIERASTPITSPSAAAAEPLTAISTFQAISLTSPVGLRAPETPLSAHPSFCASPSASSNMLLPLPSVMSPTPPMSAGALDAGKAAFSFSPHDAAAGRRSLEQALLQAAAVTTTTTTTPSSPAATPPQKRRPASRSGLVVSGSPPPYTHSKALHSILRNSPLPSRRPATAPSPRRLHPLPTVRIQEHHQHHQRRAAKRVCYHSPIEQEITTNTYTKSHIDLLVEEATTTTSPSSPRRLAVPVDLSRAFSANEIQDGGQTPGPFEDESRRLGAAMTTTTTTSSALWWRLPERRQRRQQEEQRGRRGRQS